MATQEFELPTPTIKRSERSYTVRYDTGKKTPATEYEEEGKILFTLSIGHHKAGINYWNGTRTIEDHIVVSVQNEIERERSISFIVGSGLGLVKIPDGKRFSRKRLDTAFAEWKEKIEGIFSVDRALLSTEEEHLLDALLPYLNGEKAGLA